MKVYLKKQELNAAINSLKKKQLTVGFVPTMGALHEGHLELVKTALANNTCVVVSIFVNPTQFDNPSDLNNYPRTLESDIESLQAIDENILVYAPSVQDIYEKGTKSDTFNFDGLEFEMEGKFRPGHFNGVATIVKRLFEIVQPDDAYFGEKDFQQLQIVKKLVSKYNIPVNIVPCKTYREKSGLAMSSRNTRLKPNYLEAAPLIYETLKTAKHKFKDVSTQEISNWVETQFKENELLELEYFIIADAETLKTVQKKSKNQNYRAFIAVFADDVRLIDNIALN